MLSDKELWLNYPSVAVFHEYNSSVNELKPMAEENTEVAPPTAEENPNEGLMTLTDIAEAAGVNSIFESQSETEEQVEEQEQESAEYSDEEPEPVEEPAQEPEPSQDSDGVKKRIGKLIEAREEAKAETAEIREQLARLEAKIEKPSANQEEASTRFEDIHTVEELVKREGDAEHLREWLLANPDGGEYLDAAGDEHDVDYEQAKQLIVQTDRDLRKNIPAQRELIVERERQAAVAQKTFKWMGQAGSVENQELNTVLKNNAYLMEYSKRDPYAQIVLGYAIEGFKSVNRAKKGNAQQPVQQAPQVPVAPSNAQPKVVRGKQNKKADLLKAANSGEVSDAAKYIESLFK